ncbi:hypothetical protein OH76DRAFT_820769 [Lentinus brumalis]|uniref:Uncharacterized protein n=1 Tax=Lentinus brumalis TaxID=2498619 RepID=A0A371D2S8_9APHY|nr:hypothetical protein OH76DRAFT_820769 [Polyporus brumalis]
MTSVRHLLPSRSYNSPSRKLLVRRRLTMLATTLCFLAFALLLVACLSLHVHGMLYLYIVEDVYTGTSPGFRVPKTIEVVRRRLGLWQHCVTTNSSTQGLNMTHQSSSECYTNAINSLSPGPWHILATAASFVAFGMALFLRLRSQTDNSGLRFTCIPIVIAIVSCAGVLISDASLVSEHSIDVNGPNEEGMAHSASMGSVVSPLPVHETLPAY